MWKFGIKRRGIFYNSGADPTGHPTIDMKRCTAGVDKLDLKFHGGGSWIYNAFKSIIAKQLRKSFGKLVRKFDKFNS